MDPLGLTPFSWPPYLSSSQQDPLWPGMSAIPGTSLLPVATHPSPPCLRLLLPSIPLQPRAGIQPSFPSPISIRVAL